MLLLLLDLSVVWARRSSPVVPTRPLHVSVRRELIFNSSLDGCCAGDYSDVPVRPFKTSEKGEVTWLMGNSQGYYLSTSKSVFDKPVRNCKSALASNPSSRNCAPEVYYQSVWIQTAWALKSGTVHAFVHNEFHGEWQANKSYCPSKEQAKCWYVNLVSALSTNAGRTFMLEPLPRRRIAFSTPWQYVADGGRQGMANHLGVLASPQEDGYFYSLVWGSWPQKLDPHTRQGTCLYRSSNISDSTAWRGWDGDSFSVRSINPYVDDTPAAGSNVKACCKPVLSGWFRFGWTYNTALRQYLTVGYGPHMLANGTRVPAVLYAVSNDMIHWSDAQYLMPQDITGGSLFAGQIMYPSFVDPHSAGLNFEFTGDTFWLYGSVDESFNRRNVWRWNVTVGGVAVQ